ncbi:hypothetical protein Pcinc_015756 [Petrolisthes cinctipes]|uniref:Uncharacterized protein n=1 Tax=Petrolisthes cinctipes TaxID=88211 RepID=A0AAE1FU55_PETCI|nr:hypothetical protein Pcinc_015756 [Petrolisthes cinctipes]
MERNFKRRIGGRSEKFFNVGVEREKEEMEEEEKNKMQQRENVGREREKEGDTRKEGVRWIKKFLNNDRRDEKEAKGDMEGES